MAANMLLGLDRKSAVSGIKLTANRLEIIA